MKSASPMEDDAGEGSSRCDDYDEENEDESFDEEDDEDSFSDDSSIGSDMDVEAGRLWDALNAGVGADGAGAPPAPKSPEQIIQEHLTALQDGLSTVLKIEDAIVKHIVDMPDTATSAKEDAIHQLFIRVLQAIQNPNTNSTASTIKQVILGTCVLQLWTPKQQTAVFQALAVHHSPTMTYCKLGTNDVDQLCGIPADELLSALISTSWPSLTEFQIRGIEFSSRESIDRLVQLLQSIAPTIKLFNILGIVLAPHVLSSLSSSGSGCGGLLDPLLQAVEHIAQLDEVQLHRMTRPMDLGNGSGKKSIQKINRSPYSNNGDKSIPPLVSSEALLHLLQVKPKWWRLTLDGMGLHDSHLQVLGSQLVASKDCKMNDLLSIRNNPNLSSRALSQLYHVCINKQRMGLVLSDDSNLNALVDLVRPLNNLHRRLEYKDDQGTYSQVDPWLAWFQVLSNLPWIDETRKLNYIWFTLTEQPSMIATAMDACSGK